MTPRENAEAEIISAIPVQREMNCVFRHFFPNCKDYYYLIYEDTAVHKSVGEYVDRQARKKATRETC